MPHISHTALWTQDLERLREFYQRWFGAGSNQKYTNPKTGFQSYFLSFDKGPRLEIMLAPDVAERGSGQQVGYAHIALSVGSEENVRSQTTRMQAAGVPVFSSPRTTGDGYFESVVLDPDGNHVEITT
ncbi:MAG: VOC family protein [Anaerolineales bacterium]|nr:VOC family protein [Anaerolineales bacterium]